MTRIWRVQVEGFEHKNFSAATLRSLLPRAEAFLTRVRKDYDEPKAEITEIKLIAEA